MGARFKSIKGSELPYPVLREKLNAAPKIVNISQVPAPKPNPARRKASP
jgi:hypothetical protein